VLAGSFLFYCQAVVVDASVIAAPPEEQVSCSRVAATAGFLISLQEGRAPSLCFPAVAVRGLPFFLRAYLQYLFFRLISFVVLSDTFLSDGHLRFPTNEGARVSIHLCMATRDA
jgi:hypothetical protein